MSDAQTLAGAALKNAQAADLAMNTIDQSTLPEGVWDVLYAQGEAIGQLASAVLFLATP